MIKSYLKYLFSRVNAHGLHSPFLFDFYTTVLKKASKVDTTAIEALRKKLEQDFSELEIVDFGAGSKTNKNNVRTISEIAKNAAIPKKYGKLLAKIMSHYDFKTVLEFGASVGIGTAYLGGNNVKITTLEGCPAIAAVAKQNMQDMSISEVRFLVGEFDQGMEQLGEDEKFDLIYIDGNHQYEATLRYFEFALAHAHDESFIIFDDIHWSKPMEMAWEKIKNAKSIQVSIDLFRLGIVIKKKGQEKQHFTVKY